ncbi:MAG: hypothetical protein ACRD3O_12400 [Terriglobia bacterium]
MGLRLTERRGLIRSLGRLRGRGREFQIGFDCREWHLGFGDGCGSLHKGLFLGFAGEFAGFALGGATNGTSGHNEAKVIYDRARVGGRHS